MTIFALVNVHDTSLVKYNYSFDSRQSAHKLHTAAGVSNPICAHDTLCIFWIQVKRNFFRSILIAKIGKLGVSSMLATERCFCAIFCWEYIEGMTIFALLNEQMTTIPSLTGIVYMCDCMRIFIVTIFAYVY